MVQVHSTAKGAASLGTEAEMRSSEQARSEDNRPSYASFSDKVNALKL